MIKRKLLLSFLFLTSTTLALQSFANDDIKKPLIEDDSLIGKLKDSTPINAENCFSAQYLDLEISRNVVQIVAIKVTKNGNKFVKNVGTGTGWIVKDSSDANNPYNKIITARHVAENNENNQVGIILSDGTYIGKASVVSMTPIDTTSKKRALVMDDAAVLQMDNLNYDGKKRYPYLRGIKLSDTQSTGVLKGFFEDPAGIDGGASGSPILNNKNEAVGVMTNGSPNDSDDKRVKKVDGMGERWNPKTKKFNVVPQSIYLSTGKLAWGDSLSSEYITSFIGNAGSNITYQDFDGQVTVPGFPGRVCIVYHGIMKTDR